MPAFTPRLISLAAVLCLTLPVRAADGDAEATAETTAETAAELPAVMVTARHSGEAAHDVSFAISVLDGQDIEERRLLNFEDALRSVPGVDVSSWGGFGDSNVRIRGIGSLSHISSDDASVLLSLDGAPLSGRNATLATLDIERVEVLKGPQSTLFGGSSQAGAINVTSRRPTPERQGHARFEAGQQGQLLAETALGGPLAPTLSARAAVRGSRADSYLTNAQDGKPLYKSRDAGARLSLLWQPLPATSVLLITERQQQDDRLDLMQMRPYDKHPRQDFTPGVLYADNLSERHVLEVRRDFGANQLTWLSSYTHHAIDRRSGYDRVLTQALYGLSAELLSRNQDSGNALQQELRLSSRPDAPLFWLAGFNFLDSTHDSRNSSDVQTTWRHLDFKSIQRAVYGEVTLPLAPAWKLTAGARHTREGKTYEGHFYDGSTLTAHDHGHLTDRHSTGRLALAHAWTAHSNLYAALARGHKSKGFTDQGGNAEPFKASVLHSGEIGFKHENPQQRLSLNAALFWNRVRDEHLVGFDYHTHSRTVLNADTRSHGAELEARWQAGRNWGLRGGISLTRGKITSPIADAAQGPVTAGNRLPDVPRQAASLGLDYMQALPALWGLQAPQLNASATLRHQGRRSNDVQNHFDLAAYNKLDVRLGITAGQAEFYLWADNLLDKRHDLYGHWFTPSVSVGMPARGRSGGIGVSWLF